MGRKVSEHFRKSRWVQRRFQNTSESPAGSSDGFRTLPKVPLGPATVSEYFRKSRWHQRRFRNTSESSAGSSDGFRTLPKVPLAPTAFSKTFRMAQPLGIFRTCPGWMVVVRSLLAFRKSCAVMPGYLEAME